jgi:hypothetical protein
VETLARAVEAAMGPSLPHSFVAQCFPSESK